MEITLFVNAERLEGAQVAKDLIADVVIEELFQFDQMVEDAYYEGSGKGSPMRFKIEVSKMYNGFKAVNGILTEDLVDKQLVIKQLDIDPSTYKITKARCERVKQSATEEGDGIEVEGD